MFRLAHQLVQAGHQPDLASVYRLLQAVDRVASAGLWLVVHMTYAQQVHWTARRWRPTTSRPIPKAIPAAR